MSALGGYASPVDIGLGQTPLTTDPELFNEFTEIYNAIHILNSSLDQVRSSAGTGGGGGSTAPGTPPDKSMPFTRFFTAVALVDIVKGQPICPASTGGLNGMVSGALADPPELPSSGIPIKSGTTPTSNFCTVALTDAAVGVYVRVGIGPAIVAFEGIVSGQLLWAYSSVSNTGALFGDNGFYIGDPGKRTNANGFAYAMPVATCIADGFVLFGQYLSREGIQ